MKVTTRQVAIVLDGILHSTAEASGAAHRLFESRAERQHMLMERLKSGKPIAEMFAPATDDRKLGRLCDMVAEYLNRQDWDDCGSPGVVY